MGKPHHKLNIWLKAVAFVKNIYQVTGDFPAEEKCGLVFQMHRSAVSIPSNISEGAGRNNKKEFMQFLGITQESLSELETQLIISRELGFITGKLAAEVINEWDAISKMIIGLQKSIKEK